MNPDSEPSLVTDPALADVLDQLVIREQILHRPEFGSTRADFENITMADFWEIGASGRRYSRDYIMDILEARCQSQITNVWETTDFYCQMLAEDVYLLTYTLLQQNRRKTRRSTIWQHTPSGWKIVFHQGTIVEGS